jgi:hypothetical protein
MNSIQTYRNNTLNISVEITSDVDVILTGFTAYMEIDFLTGKTLITGTTITAGVTSFIISNEINDVEPYVYTFECYIEDSTDRYTIISDSYSILP